MSNTFKDTVETDPELLWKAKRVEEQRQYLVRQDEIKHRQKVQHCVDSFILRHKDVLDTTQK